MRDKPLFGRIPNAIGRIPNAIATALKVRQRHNLIVTKYKGNWCAS